MKYYRTLFRVISIRSDNIEICIPGFDPYFYMSFSKSILSENLLKEIEERLLQGKYCCFLGKRNSPEDYRELELIDIDDFVQPELTDEDF